MRAGRGDCPRVKTTSVSMRKVVLSGLASVAPLLGLALPGAASSIVTVAPPQATPSIVSVGEAVPAPIEAKPVAEAAAADEGGTEILAIGHSVVAIGADAIPLSREEVAAIDNAAPEPEAPTLPGWLAEDGAPALRGGIVTEAAPEQAEAAPQD